MLTAITRQVSPQLAQCELTYLDRVPIDVAKAIHQHRAYERTLESLGVRVISLPPLPDQPDCVFVEDPAIVLDEIAVITHMGAEVRRGESETLAKALAPFRPLAHMHAPATLDGGDVVRVGKTLFVGLSRRTNDAGTKALHRIVEPFGYEVVAVPVTGCLHLKSACCAVDQNTVLANRNWFDASALGGLRVLDVPPEEPASADVLRISDRVLIPSAFPKTAAILEEAGFFVQPIDVSELQKAEAGVTCMSLVFEDRGAPSSQ